MPQTIDLNCEVPSDQSWKNRPDGVDCSEVRQCFSAGYGIEITSDGQINWVGDVVPIPCSYIIGCLDGGNGINISEEGVISLFSGNRGDLMFHNGTGWASLPLGTNGQVLTVSPSGVPTWQNAPTLSFNISDGINTETVGNGDLLSFRSGRNLTHSVSATNTVTYAFEAGTNQGDTLYWDVNTNEWVQLALGTPGQLLATNSTATSPEWVSPSNVLINRRHEIVAPVMGLAAFLLPNPPDANSANLQVFRNGLLQSTTHYSYDPVLGEVTLDDIIDDANEELVFIYRS